MQKVHTEPFYSGEYVLLLGLPYPLVDATLVGNFIGSTGLAVANIATPVFLLYLLMGITLGGGDRRLNWEKLGEADLKGANRVFGSVLSAG